MDQLVNNYLMARPIEMDRELASNQALGLFWQQGYRSTSLQNLLDEMGIGKGSFYAAFESKEALFADLLSNYEEETEQIFSRIRSEHKGLGAIREFLSFMFLDRSDEQRRLGCFAVNSVLELAGVDEELCNLAGLALDKMEAQLRALLTEAQAIGEVRTDQSPRSQAQLLATMIQGLRVSSRRGLSRAQSRKVIESFVQLLQH